jgi:hypothetical protein
MGMPLVDVLHYTKVCSASAPLLDILLSMNHTRVQHAIETMDESPQFRVARNIVLYDSYLCDENVQLLMTRKSSFLAAVLILCSPHNVNLVRDRLLILGFPNHMNNLSI